MQELQEQLKEKDREIKRLEREVDHLNRRVATERGMLADALAIGILPIGVELPIRLNNVSRLNYGTDGLVIEIDEKERWLHLHFIETNYTSKKGEPALTSTQRKLRSLITRNRVKCRFITGMLTQMVSGNLSEIQNLLHASKSFKHSIIALKNFSIIFFSS